MNSLKLYMKCFNCENDFTLTVIGETKFKCEKCGQKYIYKYVGDGQYEVFKYE